jgi:hypothetical protein
VEERQLKYKKKTTKAKGNGKKTTTEKWKTSLFFS